MKKDEFVDLMRQQGWTAEEVKEMVEVPLCGCVRAGVPDEYGARMVCLDDGQPPV